MSHTLVSVCIPCFNAERFIAAALDSVLAQTYPHVEIVVVNDGSTDRSREVLAKYEHRVRLIDQARCGASSARNAAFKRAAGALVMFMDADDLIGPAHLEDLLKNIDDDQTIAAAPWARFHCHSDEAEFNERYIANDLTGTDWLVEAWIHALPMMQSGMFLIPKTIVDRCGGWDEELSLMDDFEFFARVIAASRLVRFAPAARLYYRSGISGSLSSLKTRQAVELQFMSLMLGTGHLLAAETSPLTRRACANILQAFDYEHYPKHADLRAKIRSRVAELGGSDIAPDGPPGFHKLSPWIGWKAARHVQHAAERWGLNSAARLTPKPRV